MLFDLLSASFQQLLIFTSRFTQIVYNILCSRHQLISLHFQVEFQTSWNFSIELRFVYLKGKKIQTKTWNEPFIMFGKFALSSTLGFSLIFSKIDKQWFFYGITVQIWINSSVWHLTEPKNYVSHVYIETFSNCRN